jgi:hypothetical protein
MIAQENPRFSNGNAAAPSCVDMIKKTRPRPALRERDARSAVRCGTLWWHWR